MEGLDNINEDSIEYVDMYDKYDTNFIAKLFKHKHVYYDKKRQLFRVRYRDNNKKLIQRRYKNIQTFNDCYKIIKDVHYTFILLKRPLKWETCGCRKFKKALEITPEDIEEFKELHKEVDRVFDGYDSEEFYNNIRKQSWKHLNMNK